MSAADAIGERLAPAEPRRDLAQDPPVGPRLARQLEERPLARDAPLGVGDRAVLLAPRGGGQTHMREIDRVVRRDILGDDQQLQRRQRLAHGVGARQADGRIGAHHPQRLDAARGDRVEHLHGLQALGFSEIGCIPEAAHAIALGRRVAHVRGQHVGEAADLAPAHGVGLAGERQRAGARLADAAGRQVAIDDGVDLVGALRRLVDALRVAADDALRLRSTSDRTSRCRRRRARSRARRRYGAGMPARRCQRLGKSLGVLAR